MNLFLRGVMQAVVESFDLPGPILEIGSYQVEGQEEFIDLRGLFPKKEYIGVDFRAGPGVDCVASVEALPQLTGSIGTVIAMSTFEHVQRFWLGFEEVFRVLRSDGVFIVSCPFYFHQHCYPNDYWRFTPQAFESLLERYSHRIIGCHGPARRPINVWGVAFREACQPPTDGQYETYQQLLSYYAREPMPLKRRLLYQFGSLICGRRPFAPHLEREHWQLNWQKSNAA